MPNYTTTIGFHPRYLPEKIQTLVTSAEAAPENGWTIHLSTFVPQSELVDERPPQSNDAITRLSNRMTGFLNRLDNLERDNEMSVTTRPVSRIVRPTESEPGSYAVDDSDDSGEDEPKKTKRFKIRFRIKDRITPRHLWSVSMFYIITLVISGELAFSHMTGGNWIFIWIIAYNLLAVLGRDPQALLRMGSLVTDLVEITKSQNLDFKTFVISAAKEIEIQEKSIRFRDFVGPIDMIILCLVSVFIGAVTGIILDVSSPAFFGIIGMMGWGILAIIGVPQPSLDAILPDLIRLMGIDIPLSLTSNDILRAKFGR
ncbi:MAG: hypothetical protein ACTSWW_13470 [Promethearchaeota archaeon]